MQLNHIYKHIEINVYTYTYAEREYHQLLSGLHQLVTVGKKIWFWNFWDLETKRPGHLWHIIEH